jgi:integrase
MTGARHRWSYSTGERGRNRVRAFEHPVTGLIFLEFSDSGRRRRVALSHRLHEAAKTKADELALALRTNAKPLEADPTLQALFDNYVREVTPHKGLHKQRHDRSTAKRLTSFLGPDRRASTLNRRDWDGFIAWRSTRGDARNGKANGREIGARTVEYDLKFLQSVLNWAVMARDSAGRYLLQRNPLKGMPWPRDDSPRRPVLTAKDYTAMLKVAPQVDARCALALVLAHETGHRIGAIRRLRWSDVDLESGAIRWRGDQDKSGFDHTTPLSGEALKALKKERRTSPEIGEAWVFPAPEDPTKPCSHDLLRVWWERAETLAGLKHESGRGWHSLRRKFATELKDVPLPDLCLLGGWKSAQTVVKCYQRPDVGTMRAALATRARLGSGGALERPNRHRESTPRVAS